VVRPDRIVSGKPARKEKNRQRKADDA